MPSTAPQGSRTSAIRRLANLDTGAKVVGVGALTAVVGYFLPIYEEGINGISLATGSYSYFNDSGVGWWLRLLMPFVAAGLLYFAREKDTRTKIVVAVTQIAIGSLWGFALFRVLQGGEVMLYSKVGFYLYHAGMLAVVVGGAMSVSNLTRQLQGVQEPVSEAGGSRDVLGTSRKPRTSAVRRLIADLDTGAKVVGVGALTAVVGYFLPIGEGGMNGISLATSSLSDERAGDVVWWMRLLMPIAALGLLYFARKKDLRTKVFVAAAHVGIGSLWGFALFSILQGVEAVLFYEIGWFLYHIGMMAVVVGGVMSVLHLTRRLQGVRE